MSGYFLEITDLVVAVHGKILLNGISLSLSKGEIHVVMGPNGAGKSTLAGAVMGNPGYEIQGGSIRLEGEDITSESADVRARRGIFLSFQNPPEIPGVTVENFLRTACGSIRGKSPRVLAFQKELTGRMMELGMEPSCAGRCVNVGFSGGERKKMELLQMMTLHPALILLDEMDSGLDVDAVKTVSRTIREYHNSKHAFLLITHNARILEDLDVDFVHVLERGKIVRTGGRDLLEQIAQGGFQKFLGREEE